MPAPSANSMETILTFDNRDMHSQYSMVWSTTDVSDRRGGGPAAARRLARGRRRLHVGSLALSALLTMHCRIPASTLTGGFFFFMVFLLFGVVALANPLRHFEVYLGQWSISGPGRAFRIIPMFDGIGIAMCINALVRAIMGSVIAAMAGLYVLHSLSDEKLPFTYCRDFDLTAYKPETIDMGLLEKYGMSLSSVFSNDVGSRMAGVKHGPSLNYTNLRDKSEPSAKSLQIEVCKEVYSGTYPPMFSTPAYNFYFVEVVRFRTDFKSFNAPLGISICFIWIVIWLLMLLEKFRYRKLVWNNLSPSLITLPWLWTFVLISIGIANFTVSKNTRNVFQFGAENIADDFADAIVVALYIHSASVGTELIHGKGLNYYASGHIDPLLNKENVWHSVLTLLLAVLHSCGAVLCTYADAIPASVYMSIHKMHQETMLWIIPMYSVCASAGAYSHFASTIIFGGLMMSYLIVAYILVKTALHIIFEYRVKLVYFEQITTFGCAFICMALSMLFATNHGVALIESVESLMVGIALPFVCGMELVGLLYVYRSHDFISDMNVATEDNTCSTRIGIQWRLIPFITLATLVMKITTIIRSTIPRKIMLYGLIPLICLIMAVPLRACFNAYTFLRPGRRRGA